MNESEWFLFADNQITGPFGLDEALLRDDEGILASRRGVKQWYPIEELIAAHREGRLREYLGDSTSAAPTAPIEQKVRVVAKNVGVRRREQAQHSLAPRVTRPQAPRIFEEKAKTYQSMMQVKGRARLGQYRSLGMALLGSVATAGLYWPFWWSDARREILRHSAGNTHVRLAPSVITVLPVFHLFAAFQLAQLVREMEEDNGYVTVTPWVAAILAIIPPFAILYLQRAINRHWMLHLNAGA